MIPESVKFYYILDTFPNLTENFILREILALRESGKRIQIISLRKPAKKPVDPELKALMENVIYVEDFSFTGKLWTAFISFFIHPLLFINLNFSLLVDFFHSPRLSYHRLRGALNAMMIARGTSIKPDHIHAHFAYVTTDLAKVLADLTGCKWSVSVHAWDIFTQPAKVLKRRLKTVDKVFACSKHGQETLAEKVPDVKDRIVLMYHGIETAKFAGKQSTGHIVSIGRLEEKKGFDILIKAGKILSQQGIEPEFKIIGDGPLKDSLSSEIRKLELKNFSFTGSLDFDEVKQILATSEMLVQPSIIASSGDRDGIPNVLLEAMALGKPVISTNVGGIEELIEDARNGLMVEAGDAEKLANAIKKLIENKDEANRIGKVARECVKKNFELMENIKAMDEYFG